MTWYHNYMYFVHLGFGMIMYSVLLNEKHVITECNTVFFLTWSKNPYRKTRYQSRSLFICILEFCVFRHIIATLKDPYCMNEELQEHWILVLITNNLPAFHVVNRSYLILLYHIFQTYIIIYIILVYHWFIFS